MTGTRAASGLVLLRRTSLGDVVLLGAVTAGLTGVTVVTAPAYAGLAARFVGVDRVVSWPDGADPVALARAIGPGRWVDLQGSLRSQMLCAAAGQAAARIRKRSVRRRLRLLGLPVGPRPLVTDLYAEACGVRASTTPWIRVPERPRRALALLPGASRATKRWSPDGFAAVGRAFDGPVVVIGSASEAGLCARVAAGVPGAEVVCEDGFDATLAALAGCRVAVGNDSGLLHVAGACGVPLVGVFGSTHPDDGFFPHRGEVVSRALGCRPCTLHGRAACPLGDLACLALDPAAVIAAMARQCAG